MAGKDTSPPLTFVPNEYLAAERRFVFEAIDEIARRSHPLLSQIGTEPTESIVVSQITTDDGETLELEGVALKATLELSKDEIVVGRSGPLLTQLSRAGSERAAALVQHLFASISRIAEATGNTVSVNDRPLLDALVEVLEKTDLQFDEEGRLEQTFYADPATLEEIDVLMETSELKALLERKRKEFDARKRRRLLP